MNTFFAFVTLVFLNFVSLSTTSSFLSFFCCDLLAAPLNKEVKIALILDRGGPDDKSFNESARRGGERAEKELGIRLKYMTAEDDAMAESIMRKFSQQHYDLIIAIGFSMSTPLMKVAVKFPTLHYAIVDAVVDLPNVASLLFREQEGTYLAGALSALISNAHTVGFIGGMKIPLIDRFLDGFENGAHAIDPKTKVLTSFLGTTSSAWSNPSKAKMSTSLLINQGADVLMHAAGASGLGLFDAVQEESVRLKKNIFAIGCDSNQNYLKPHHIIASMVKHVDESVYQAIVREVHHDFTAQKIELGLREKGVALELSDALMESKVITKEISKKIELLQQHIIEEIGRAHV